ncbi:MAG TPA: hypothetical protein PLN52_10600 [Opitutaceae bacterium]|nr:hypothetical protein [Opitutaceae bacterium]
MKPPFDLRGVRRKLHWRSLASGLVPATILLLTPKCPFCVVAYVSLFTGIGLSVSAATYLRWGLLGISSLALVYLLVRFGIALHTPATAPSCRCSTPTRSGGR